jgi:cobalt-zinc-cadmium efflux system outer membrane protein
MVAALCRPGGITVFVVPRSLVLSALAAALIVTARPAASFAQAAPAVTPPAPAPAVDALVQRALERAPSLAARRERIRAAELAIRAADALPDPMVEVMYQSFNFPRYTIGSDMNSMTGASVRLDLLSGSRRTTRRGVAQAEANRRGAERRLMAADLGTEVRVQYARLYAIDREGEALNDAAQLARMLETTASARYAAGESDQATVLRMQLEQTRIGQRAADLNAERLTVQAAINRLTNDPPHTAIGRVSALPAPRLPTAVSALADQAVKEAPAIAVRRSEVDVATRQVDAARAELKPACSVGAGLYWQGGTDRMVNFSVGVELPFWKKRKQLPMLASAESERRAAQLEMDNAAVEVRAQVASLLAEYQNAIDQIQRYQGGLLPQNSAALDATRASYLGGRGDFVSVLDEFRRWVDLRTELAVREADRYSAQARLVALVDQPATPSLQ